MTSFQNRGGPTKEIDVDLLVFVERYASDLLRWDLISLFAQNPNLYDTADNVARRIGRNPRVVRSELGELVMLGVLECGRVNGDRIYHLTQRSDLRRLALKFAKHLDTSRRDAVNLTSTSTFVAR